MQECGAIREPSLEPPVLQAEASRAERTEPVLLSPQCTCGLPPDREVSPSAFLFGSGGAAILFLYFINLIP